MSLKRDLPHGETNHSLTGTPQRLECSVPEAALAYARMGWRVFPLCWPTEDGTCACGRGHRGRDIGKAPLTRHGALDATDDESVVRNYWIVPANLGIAAGAASGLVVLDVDGPEGQASLRGKHLPVTPTARTAKGTHYYFRHPGGVVRNAVGLLPGVDVRGDGGYVVAPPSRHASGVLYCWAEGLSPWDVPLAEAPAWLLVEEREPAQTTGPSLRRGRGPDFWLEFVATKIEEGTRNSKLCSLIGHLLRRRVNSWLALDLVLAYNQANCLPPLPDEEVLRIFDSVSRRELARRKWREPARND